MIDELTGIEFPLMQSEVLDGYFGDPDEDGEFVQGFMRTCDLTQYAADFAHVRDYTGAPWRYKIYCNYILIRPLQRAFRLIVQRGLAGELKSYDGCFNIRRSRSGNITSMHSWGLAVDFNAATNPFRRSGLVTDFSDDFVRCFAESGFEWGGLWASPVDPMHFQFAWVRDYRGSSNPLAPLVWED